MKKVLDDVKAFHEAMNCPVATNLTVPSDDRIRLRAKLIREEHHEIMCSIFPYWETTWDDGRIDVNLVELADGLADLIYVAVGCALEFGIPLDKVWDEVQRSNMAKRGVDGKVHYRDDGKVLKPEGWTPPDIAKVLGVDK